MPQTQSRHLVGFVKPGKEPGPLEEIRRFLPASVDLVELVMDLPEVRGPARLAAAVERLDKRIGELAAMKADIIFPEGSALYMTNGLEGERAMIREWESRHGTPVAPTGFTLSAAMNAMKFRKIIAVRPFTWTNGADFTARYFSEAGFDVAAVASPTGHNHTSINTITPTDVYETVKQACRAHSSVDGVVILAAIMASTAAIQAIEDDLGVPVVTATAARCWLAQKRLNLRHPHDGYGRLLSALPD